MSDVAIKVENLSKRYRIGLEEEVHDTLAGQLTSYLKSPMRNLRRLRRLTRFGENGQGLAQDPDDVIWALKDVSFEVERGEILGIIGRNGAGKSTLLKILSRITHPTSGKVALRGRVSSLLEVGTGFHPELTGRENVYLNGTVLGMTKAEIDRKFDEIVAFSGVEKFIDTPVKRYSSGMRVRLAFSVAAHLEPEILLVDEVLAVGDVMFQKKCLGKMRDVAQGGRTVLFVSHQMSSIQQLCKSAMLLEDGSIAYLGEVTKCIERYLQSGAERTDSILSHVEYNAPDIHLHEVTINGSGSDALDLLPGVERLDVRVTGSLDKPASILLEARIHDQRENCLAFFTPRQTKEHFERLAAGRFQLHEAIALPPLNQGEYVLSLYIVNADQRIPPKVRMDRAVHIRAEGTPTITGWVYKFARGNGWILLPSAEKSREGKRGGE